MSFGLHKQGQGYWVRVLTATFIGALLLGGAGWLWTQLGIIPLPRPTWVLTVEDPTGDAAAESIVTLWGDPAATGTPVQLGTATVRSSTIAIRENQLVVGSIAMDRDYTPDMATRVRSAAGSASTLDATVTATLGVPVFEQIYLQAAGVGLLLLVGAWLIYRFVGTKPRTVDFLVATDGEIRKVNWSTRRDIIGSTWVVVTASFLIAGALFLVDLSFKWFFGTIGIL